MTLFLIVYLEGPYYIRAICNKWREKLATAAPLDSHPKASVPRRPGAGNKGSHSGEMSIAAQLQRKPGLRDTNW